MGESPASFKMAASTSSTVCGRVSNLKLKRVQSQVYGVSHHTHFKLQPANRRKYTGSPMECPSPCRVGPNNSLTSSGASLAATVARLRLGGLFDGHALHHARKNFAGDIVEIGSQQLRRRFLHRQQHHILRGQDIQARGGVVTEVKLIVNQLM